MKPQFQAGLTAGLNFSELEGDGFTDYFGLNTGVFTSASLSRKTAVSVELLYSQNGEYILPVFYPDVTYGKVKINHIEVPVHVDWSFSTKRSEKLNKLALSFGLAYTRLLNYYAETELKENITDQIEYDRISSVLAQLALTYNLSDKWSVNIKLSDSLISKELNGTVAFRVLYTFLK